MKTNSHLVAENCKCILTQLSFQQDVTVLLPFFKKCSTVAMYEINLYITYWNYHPAFIRFKWFDEIYLFVVTVSRLGVSKTGFFKCCLRSSLRHLTISRLTIYWCVNTFVTAKQWVHLPFVSAEHGRLFPGRRHDPGRLCRFLPEQKEAGPPETGEDWEAAGDGAEGPAPPLTGCCCPLLPTSGRARCVVPPRRWQQQQLLSGCPAQKETSRPSIPAPSRSKPNSNHYLPVSFLLPAIAVPTHPSQNRAALPQHLYRIPKPLYLSVPSCSASEAPASFGPAAWVHHSISSN